MSEQSDTSEGIPESQSKPPDLKTAEGVAKFMAGSKSSKDWSTRTDQVKAANGGDYPSFWHPTVIGSGLYSNASKAWGGTGELFKVTLTSGKELGAKK